MVTAWTDFSVLYVVTFDYIIYSFFFFLVSWMESQNAFLFQVLKHTEVFHRLYNM